MKGGQDPSRIQQIETDRESEDISFKRNQYKMYRPMESSSCTYSVHNYINIVLFK